MTTITLCLPAKSNLYIRIYNAGFETETETDTGTLRPGPQPVLIQ